MYVTYIYTLVYFACFYLVMEFTSGLVISLLDFSRKKSSMESFSFQFYLVYDKPWIGPRIGIVKQL